MHVVLPRESPPNIDGYIRPKVHVNPVGRERRNHPETRDSTINISSGEHAKNYISSREDTPCLLRPVALSFLIEHALPISTVLVSRGRNLYLAKTHSYGYLVQNSQWVV